ncbi:S41 family peptidase [Trichlorobacter lovleyi]|uniref:S41 family peptidase n=1 Tax=Trichlorobacter lovleyi TaxID=313985 RepID=UPI0023F0428A|nr:S41 family peptidase [Trichlorobacter lovleyi]
MKNGGHNITQALLRGLLALLVLMAICIPAYAAPDLKLFQDVVDKVEKHYVDPPDYQLMLRGAMRGLEDETLPPTVTNAGQLNGSVAELIARRLERGGTTVRLQEEAAARQMLLSLDPHSMLMTPQEYQELFVATKGSFSGIGAEVKAAETGILVVSPIEGGPAFEAGIKAGEIIRSIDRVSTVGMRLEKAVMLLRGKDTTTVLLEVEGRSGLRTVSLVRRPITIKSVSFKELGDGIGYLKISQFQEQTARAVEEALYKLGAKGMSKGLVLDLRNNPGGLLSSSVAVADMFVDTGTLLMVRGRSSGQQSFDGKTIGTHRVPVLAVLVNKGSASASEILAGVLQERKAALLLGERTFGKGSVQTLYSLADGYGMRLTTSHYYLPSGRMVQAGIEPDIALEQAEGRDSVLEYARVALQSGKLTRDSRAEVLALLSRQPAISSTVQTQPAAGPPVITVTSPAVQRGLAVKVRSDAVTVSGTASSSRGIARVTVNGQQAALDDRGNFSVELLLRPGENLIEVQALDLQRVAASEQFRIVREAAKPVLQQAVAPSVFQGVGSGTYHALLIAVQDYRSAEITKLDHPVQDASRLRDLLISNYTFDPSNVTLLKNPDRKEIFKAFESLRKTVGPNDSVLVFFAGHGVWREDMQQGFWLPRDASGMSDPSDWIPNSTLRDYIKAIRARHLLLMADACFSGGIFKVRDAFSRPDAAVEKVFEMPSRKALTSGSLKTVPDRSVFVEYLLKRLRENRDQYLDAQKLYSRFREAVINNSPVGQTPLYGAISETGDEGGDFIFVRRVR